MLNNGRRRALIIPLGLKEGSGKHLLEYWEMSLLVLCVICPASLGTGNGLREEERWRCTVVCIRGRLFNPWKSIQISIGNAQNMETSLCRAILSEASKEDETGVAKGVSLAEANNMKIDNGGSKRDDEGNSDDCDSLREEFVASGEGADEEKQKRMCLEVDEGYYHIQSVAIYSDESDNSSMDLLQRCDIGC
ncbi:unnamed protein product [Ilex paraguariensis]|uniref:Uncharacterized protein n=1 Tax=Ilex paraguariensis TaxID=185542 RepID=A0ABC8SKD3_9AQUA